MATPHAPLSGYLLKRSKAVWKSRYACLDRGVLYLFKHKHHNYPSMTILLAGCTAEATYDPDGRSFVISHPSRASTKQLLLATSESHLLSTWLDAIVAHAQLDVAVPTPRAPHRAAVVPSLPYDIPAADNRDVPPKYRNVVETMVATFLSQYVYNTARWTLETEHSAVKSTQLYYCQAPAAAMSKLMLKHPADDIASMVVDPTFDAHVRDSTTIHTFNESTTLQHITTKDTMFPSRGRQYVVLTHRRTLPDQSVVVVSQSVPNDIEHLNKSRHSDPAVLRIEGFHIVPNLDDTAAEVTYVVHVDGDETLPDHVVISRALKLDALRVLLEPPGSPTSPRAHHALPQPFPDVISSNNIIEKSPRTDARDVGVYSIPRQFAHEIDSAIATLVAIATGLSSWTFQSEKEGVRAYSKQPDGSSLTSVLGVGSMAFPASTILGFLLDTSRKVAYDPMCAAAFAIARLDPHTSLDYYASKPVLIVSGRDFVNVVHWRVLPDQSIAVVAKATQTDQMPVNPGLVRGEVHVAGWHIVPTGQHSADVSFMVKLDLKGSIPTFVQNKIAVDQAYVFLAVRKQLEALPNIRSFPVVNDARGQVAAAPVAPLVPPDDTLTSESTSKLSKESTKKGSMTWINDTPAIPTHTTEESSVWMSWGVSLLAFLGATYIYALGGILVGAMYIGYHVLTIGSPSLRRREQGPVASWKASLSASSVHGSILVDCSDTLAYIQHLEKRGAVVTLPDIVVRAVARAVRHTPSFNGHAAFGSLYPSNGAVNVSCLIHRHDDTYDVTLAGADTLSIHSIATIVASGVDDAGLSSPSNSCGLKPTHWASVVHHALVQFWIDLVEWLSQQVPSMGVTPHRGTHAIVADVGKMGLDDTFISMFRHVPLTVMVGAIAKRAVVVEGGDGEDQVVVRPMLCLNVQVNPRYADPAGIAQLTRHLREFMEHPGVLDDKDLHQ
ncbi:hypothetical protein DYB31_005479 [Aphanomyces astaci]|uniref:PH domain-containing protein n=1 Tax=Aphanomyces astaci TaxID=112090 RepID=A0A397FBC7_APHAT|nr:hypothetical protein DYB31_005479 [Aphanomyces astaci]